MLRIAVILGSARLGRNGKAVAQWVYDMAKRRASTNNYNNNVEFEYIDIKDFDLPRLDEPIPPSQGQYNKDHTKIGSAKIQSFDAFIFVTPEYNHGIPGALKNAINSLLNYKKSSVENFLTV